MAGTRLRVLAAVGGRSIGGQGAYHRGACDVCARARGCARARVCVCTCRRVCVRARAGLRTRVVASQIDDEYGGIAQSYALRSSADHSRDRKIEGTIHRFMRSKRKSTFGGSLQTTTGERASSDPLRAPPQQQQRCRRERDSVAQHGSVRLQRPRQPRRRTDASRPRRCRGTSARRRTHGSSSRTSRAWLS
jgi:hypothetical protein